jgi:hypothetical protein
MPLTDQPSAPAQKIAMRSGSAQSTVMLRMLTFTMGLSGIDPGAATGIRTWQAEPTSV